MRLEVCDRVADVGTESAQANAKHSNQNHLPGNSPVSIVLSTQEETNRPAGTTWVFADGSQVLASASTTNASVDDVMNEIDQFGLQTGGEHYARGGEAEEGEEEININEECNVREENQEEEEDDLDKFMDDFEQNTGGENFKRG